MPDTQTTELAALRALPDWQVQQLRRRVAEALWPGAGTTSFGMHDLDDEQNAQVDRAADVLAQYERERVRLQKFATMVSDLDRNEHGRHEGDVDGWTPSEGNPRLKTGDVLGYSLHAAYRYEMPEPALRHDPDAWKVLNGG